jgi:hypothetical protein
MIKMHKIPTYNSSWSTKYPLRCAFTLSHAENTACRNLNRNMSGYQYVVQWTLNCLMKWFWLSLNRYTVAVDLRRKSYGQETKLCAATVPLWLPTNRAVAYSTTYAHCGWLYKCTNMYRTLRHPVSGLYFRSVFTLTLMQWLWSHY